MRRDGVFEYTFRKERPVIVILVIILFAFQVVPITVSAAAVNDFQRSTIRKMTNSTLGERTVIGMPARGYIEVISSYSDAPISPAFSLFNSSLEYETFNESAILGTMQEELAGFTSYYQEDLTPGEYMPDVSVARITKNLWIDNPESSTTFVYLSFAFSNPDEKYTRYFRIYLDGVKVYEKMTLTTRLVDWLSCYISDGLHEFVFEVRHGAYGNGWALEYARLETSEHDSMHTSAVLARNEEMPQVYVSQVNRYVYVHDEQSQFSEKVHVAVESDDPYTRWLRVRVDDQLVFERVIYQSYETTLDVSSYMPATGIHKVTVEIRAGHYRQWNLVYLALERSEAKYIPKSLNLILAFDWNPDDAYLNDFIAGLREFVDHAWDAFEEQLIITRIDIYVNVVPGIDPLWDSAHICCEERNDFDPLSNMTYAIDPQGNPIPGSLRGIQKIYLPKYWPHWSTTWTIWLSYLAITHELAHAFFNVADEYVTGPDVDPPQSAECRSFWESASIMDQAYWPYPKTEFCVRSNHDPDGDTSQTWWWWGWSVWQTIAHFSPNMYEPFTVYDTTVDNVAANYVQIVCH